MAWVRNNAWIVVAALPGGVALLVAFGLGRALWRRYRPAPVPALKAS